MVAAQAQRRRGQLSFQKALVAVKSSNPETAADEADKYEVWNKKKQIWEEVGVVDGLTQELL